MKATQPFSDQQSSLSATATNSLFRSRVYSFSFWLLCAALLIALHATHQLDSDEGVILNGAWNILNGRTLYTDFFEFVAPGSFYLIFAAWKLFGPHFWIAKSIAILAIAGAAAGVYGISQLILAEQQVAVPRSALFFGPFVFCLFSGYWPAINHNTFNIALVIWSTFFVSRSILRRYWVDAGIGGLICGTAVLFTQHKGAVLAATTILMLVFFHGRDKDGAWWKNAGAFLMGSLAPVAGMLLFWPASLLFENLIRFPATHYLEVNRLDLSLFLIVATFVVLAAWPLRHSSSRAVWFLICLQVTLFLTAFQRPDLPHITLTLFPLLALFPLLLNTALGPSRISKLFPVWIAAGLLILNALVPVMIAGGYSSPFFDKSQHPAILYVRENCTASPYIYAGPFAPGIYFETGKLNPTRYSVLLTNSHTSGQFLDAVRDIEARRPQCIITNYPLVEKFNYSRKNVVDEYINANYELAYQAGRVQVSTLRTRFNSPP
jgi:hypothetical protein